ncbi:MAG: CDP-diacylglycerol--glycerol-3-phosphate 3-phosphatidyltransferase [Candidatus Omnitrophica bacterium]|nr:CDP-diacylglycerol--glycerol-3-phosphate 3-phosphatidyltransferase [Candidatus Omnitrophota bacterium]
MNLANKLTLSRIVLAFFFILSIHQPGVASAIVATLIFTVASLTDYYDGYVAKKYGLQTDFGKLMDPIADKFLILSAFIVFVRMNIVADWMVILIFTREILITGLRIFALTKDKIIAAERAGKHKTVSQIVAIYIILGFIIFKRSVLALSGWTTAIDQWWSVGINVTMLVTVALTLISGFSYLWTNRDLIQT